MKRILLYTLLLVTTACTSFNGNPYMDSLRTLRVQVIYPEGYENYLRAGVDLTLSDRYSPNLYTVPTDAAGTACFHVTSGHYALALQDRPDPTALFNGSLLQIDLTKGDADVELLLEASKPGQLIIREIYTCGCPADPPATGTNDQDKYFILYNNSSGTLYLDGLCFGCVAPYNSTVQNPWIIQDEAGNIAFRDYATITDCVWQFGGDGDDFPLESGEEAIVALSAAVDHTKTYSLSVNLDRVNTFACYDFSVFPGTESRPALVPGMQVAPSHYLLVAKSTSRAKAYPVSNHSPAIILFRAPFDFDLQAYWDNDQESTIPLNTLFYTKVPWEWVVEAVEIADGTGAMRTRRIPTSLDAEAFVSSGTRLGHAIQRRVDEAATAEAGFTVYMDTNNSANDFVETEKQSLR